MFGIDFARIAPVVARVSALVMLAAALICAGVFLAGKHYSPIVADLNQKLGAANASLSAEKGANTQLQQAIASQQQAFAKLQADALQRQKSAAEAMERAGAVAAQNQARANVLLSSKAPAGANLCEAARALVDEEINLERPK